MNDSITPEQLTISVQTSREFSSWLNKRGVSLALSSYQTGTLLLLGQRPDGRLSLLSRNFSRCMGIAYNDQHLFLATKFQLWQFENMLEGGELNDGYDALFVPKIGYTTGNIDTHDLALDKNNQPIFINTQFNCLATLDEHYSFKSIWIPPFISKLVGEDRCHLNGLAMIDGTPAFATACSQSDVNDGWRDSRYDGGIVIDIRSNKIVCSGLSMPHSPRWYNGRLWCLNSGKGQFGWIDTKQGSFNELAFCPGYARGLAFIENYAIIGLSSPRHDHTFSDLPLGEELKKRNTQPRCGLIVVDLNTGDTVQWLRLEGSVVELYDIATLANIKLPNILGFEKATIQQNIWYQDDGKNHHWSSGGS